MASIDSLPPDQRAVLELVLGAGRSYDEIARILSIDRAGVRERAMAALDALGPQTRVSDGRRALITDYLLGALPERVAEEVRNHLAESASERAWARVVASELQGIANKPLPEIPTEARASANGAEAPPPEPPTPRAPRTRTRRRTREPPRRTREPRRRTRDPRPSSRVGGAVLLGIGVIAVVAIVLAFVVLPGGGTKHPRRAASTRTSTTSSIQILAQINLRPPSGGTKPIGLADVLKVQGRVGIAIVAQGLTANSKHPPNAYAVWLYNSPSDSQILGFVNPGVGSNGQLRTAGALPTNAHHYQKVLVTLETQSKPKAPGPIVLEGNLTGV
jgi:hypothetical protein